MCGNISDRRSIWEGQLSEPKRRVEVSPAALTWRFSRSSGPGGQHVNTSDSRVELICDLSQITAERAVLERITKRFGNELRIVVSSQRSQLQNRKVAMEKLIDQLEKTAKVPRNRRATKPTWSSVQNRLDNKRQTSLRKAARRSTLEE
jgi:ribosome-associated protein